MFKINYNIYVQCFFYTFLWQLMLLILYKIDLIYYNPLFELSDIIPNYLFIFFLSVIFSSPLFSFILICFLYNSGILLYFLTRQNITLHQLPEVPELIAIFSPMSYFFIIFLLILIYFTYKTSRKINFIVQKTKPRIFHIGISFLFLSLIAFGAKIYYPKIENHNTESFNKFATWKHGGQLYSIIYHYADTKNMNIKLNKVSTEIYPNLKFKKNPQSELIIIILLESFVPRSDLQSENFKPFLKEFGFKSKELETPAYGGLSAKSEFEILCGLPELQPLGNISFNYLGGKKVNFCLPSLISKFNYKTISITGTASHFHNAKNAYSSIGFDQSLSKKDISHDDLDGIHPSDKSIFEKAYNEILIKDDDKLFLYVFTAAGHAPYTLNKKNRPRLSDDLYFDRVTYTEQELKEFLTKLDMLNIDTSIIILSDHATNATYATTNSNSISKNKLLNVWYRSNSLEDFDKNCSQYFQIPKFFTNQKCKTFPKNGNNIVDRGKNFPNYDDNNTLILKLIKNSKN